jgi:hypothetical protein
VKTHQTGRDDLNLQNAAEKAAFLFLWTEALNQKF